MKLRLISLSALLCSFATIKPVSLDNAIYGSRPFFKLDFVTVGFGSNQFEMQPVFRVDGTRFIYTSEIVWIREGEKNVPKDTLLTGDFRTSSIDSISGFIDSFSDTVIYKADIGIMSGSASYIKVADSCNNIRFELHNRTDTTADKIVAVLNTYIPDSMRKLYISDAERNRRRVRAARVRE